MDFALNQKTAPHLEFGAFLDLAARLGCVGVEPRNDLGRPFFDGIAPKRAREMAADRGLRLVGLSEIYPFDDWNEERRGAVSRLIRMAEAAGAETVSLIPRVDLREPAESARAAKLRAVVAEIVPMLSDTGVVGLLEPIGFAACSMKYQREAAAAIDALDAGDRLGILHDTFQHSLAKDRDIMVRHIRMVHISGVSGGIGDLTDDQDKDRIPVDDSDRTETVGQMKYLLANGSNA